MQFITQAVTVLQTLVIALGAGLAVWGVVNLMEGYGNDNPGAKSQGKKEHFVGSFYDADEMNALFAASKGTKLEIPILFGAFYGLRRSEAIGLKWDAIDFEHDTLTIRHTVTSCDIDGKLTLVASDTTKTKSSMRTLPLVPFVKTRLLALKEEQAENRRLCGRSYIREYQEYALMPTDFRRAFFVPQKYFNFFQKGADYFATFFTTAW